MAKRAGQGPTGYLRRLAAYHQERDKNSPANQRSNEQPNRENIITRLYDIWHMHPKIEKRPPFDRSYSSHLEGLQCDVDDPGRGFVKKFFLNRWLNKLMREMVEPMKDRGGFVQHHGGCD